MKRFLWPFPKVILFKLSAAWGSISLPYVKPGIAGLFAGDPRYFLEGTPLIHNDSTKFYKILIFVITLWDFEVLSEN